MDKIQMERIDAKELLSTLPKKYPDGYVMDFYPTFSKAKSGNGIIIKLSFDVYHKIIVKKKYSFHTTATFIIKSTLAQETDKYNIFYQCLTEEITIYRLTLSRLKLKDYDPPSVIAPLPSFEAVLPLLKELDNPGDLFSKN